jgi:hypothetical protein
MFGPNLNDEVMHGNNVFAACWTTFGSCPNMSYVWMMFSSSLATLLN